MMGSDGHAFHICRIRHGLRRGSVADRRLDVAKNGPNCEWRPPARQKALIINSAHCNQRVSPFCAVIVAWLGPARITVFIPDPKLTAWLIRRFVCTREMLIVPLIGAEIWREGWTRTEREHKRKHLNGNRQFL